MSTTKTVTPPPPVPTGAPSDDLFGAEPSIEALVDWARSIRVIEDHETARNAAEAYHHEHQQAGIKAFLG